MKYSAYKFFLLRLTLFLTPVFIFLIYTEITLRRYSNGFDKTRQSIEKFMSGIEVLILGNSQVYIGYEPEKLTFNAFNFSHDSQSLQYDMMLTGNYLPMLKNLKAVVIPVSCFSFHYDIHRSPGNRASGRYFFSYDMPLPKQGIFSFRKYSLIAAYTPRIAFGIVFLDRFRSSGFTDELNPKTGTILNENSRMIAYSLISGHHDLIQQNYQLNIKNLEKFITLLKEKNIEVIFTTIPVSAVYHNILKESVSESNRELISRIISQYGCQFIDIESTVKLGDEYFSDIDHLNAKGAAIVTAKLDSAMKNAILVTRN